jgi:hypothetical protein
MENAPLPGQSSALGMNRETMASASVPLEFIYQRGASVRRGDALVDAARAEGFAERHSSPSRRAAHSITWHSRRFQLPLLGSNQDSSDPESARLE